MREEKKLWACVEKVLYGGPVEGEESVLEPWGVYVVCLGKANTIH